MPAMLMTLNVDIKTKFIGLHVRNKNFLQTTSRLKLFLNITQNLTSFTSVDATYSMFTCLVEKRVWLSIKTTFVNPTHVKFKERQGRICSVMC